MVDYTPPRLAERITTFIRSAVTNSAKSKNYRLPIVGFADAGDELFATLGPRRNYRHLLPSDILPDARSVVSFFVPFNEQIVQQHAQHRYVAREWALAYIETNELISSICADLSAWLKTIGVLAEWRQPTHDFDAERLMASWSHKHVGYIAGLGTFGVHQMLITQEGCAGRLGSVVTDAALPASPRWDVEACQHLRGERCLVCVERCPTGALKSDILDRHQCYARLVEADLFYSDLATCDVCGKCATGPCALAVPLMTEF